MKIRSILEAEAALLPFVPLVAQLTGKDTTLERIRPLMELLGNPQDKLRVIHIAGTSGKTSTAYFMAALLRADDKKVGLTVSPHVDSITERVQLNGSPLADHIFCSKLEDFLKIVEQLAQKPSYFELLYAFALWVFASARVDYAVVETGMGGLFDATNIVTRSDKVCVITDIGFDHMHILGKTLPEIAAQKIGIVHQDNPVFMYDQASEIMHVVQDWTRQHNAPLSVTTEQSEREKYAQDISAMPLYQQRNWLLANYVYRFLQSRDGLGTISEKQLEESRGIQVPGRMDIRQVSSKTIVMDGAHNAQKMTAFFESFAVRYPKVKPVVLLALKQGKEYQDISPLLAKVTNHIIVTIFTTSQDLPALAINPVVLAESFKSAGITMIEVISDQTAAFQAALKAPEQVVIITGSFYLLSQIRNNEHLV